MKISFPVLCLASAMSIPVGMASCQPESEPVVDDITAGLTFDNSAKPVVRYGFPTATTVMETIVRPNGRYVFISDEDWWSVIQFGNGWTGSVQDEDLARVIANEGGDL